jgi:hypothetical protein
MPNFEFPADLTPTPDKRVAVIDAVSGKAGLFAVLTPELSLPGWFGHNWDALVDGLRDLSWIPEKQVVLHHPDLPGLSNDDLATYLDILMRADHIVGLHGERRLRVSFASGLERQLAHLSGDPVDH